MLELGELPVAWASRIRYRETMKLGIDGALHLAGRRIQEGATATVVDKWTAEPLAKVVLADASLALEAADAARDAHARLGQIPSFERRALLARVARRLREGARSFAAILSREAGKPLALAHGEVMRAATVFELAAEEATRIGGEVIDAGGVAGGDAFTARMTRVARGPVLGITPFNFPLNLVAHKIAPAIAAGASIVVKPAPQAPLSAIVLGGLLRAEGAPEGLVQIVPCENEVATSLVQSEAFRVLSFTGSDRVGWKLRNLAEKKHVVLELGGNAAVIAHDVDDIAKVADRIVWGAFAYAGQVCIKVQRLIAHERIAAALFNAIAERVQALAPCSAEDPAGLMGPLIDEAAAERVDSWLADAEREGARARVRGRREGAILGPSFVELDGDGRGLAIIEEEVFGPVLTAQRYANFDEALALAESARFGLQAGLYTRDRLLVQRAFDELHVGGLVVGDVPTVRLDHTPYGGVRGSGLGREGVRFAVLEMTEPRLLLERVR